MQSYDYQPLIDGMKEESILNLCPLIHLSCVCQDLSLNGP